MNQEGRIRAMWPRSLFEGTRIQHTKCINLSVIGNPDAPIEAVRSAYRRLLARHKVQADRLYSQMVDARDDRHRFLVLQKRYQRSFSVRLVETAKQNLRVDPRFRVAPHRVIITAASLNVFSPLREPVSVKEVRKPNGGRRYIHRFGVEGRARQAIAAKSARPIAEFHPAQFDVEGRGGAPGLIRAVTTDIDTIGYSWAIELDVRAAFQSVAEATCIEPHMREIAPDILRHTVLNNSTAITHSSTLRDIMSRLKEAGKIRSGLPTGSLSSSLFFAIIMGRVLRRCVFHADSRVYSAADNVLVLGKTRRAAVETAMTIVAAFRREPTGQFGLHTKPARRLDWGFEFLGRRIRRRLGHITVRPGNKGFRQFAKRVRDAANNCLPTGAEIDCRIERLTKSFVAAFPDCTSIDLVAAGFADRVVVDFLLATPGTAGIRYNSMLVRRWSEQPVQPGAI